MSCRLSEDLKAKYGMDSIKVRKGDFVKTIKGNFEGRQGKIIRINRKNWVFDIDKLTKKLDDGKLNYCDRVIGTVVYIPYHTSGCIITKLKIDKNRKAFLNRKKREMKETIKLNKDLNNE